MGCLGNSLVILLIVIFELLCALFSFYQLLKRTSYYLHLSQWTLFHIYLLLEILTAQSDKISDKIVKTVGFCVFCNEQLEGNVVRVTQQVLKKIQDSSEKRNDGLITKLKQVADLKFHVKCRKSYVNEDSIKAYTKRKNLLINATDRTSSMPDYNSNYLFCATDSNKDSVS